MTSEPGSGGAEESSIDPNLMLHLAPLWQHDPYAAYRYLRSADPVHWSQCWGVWLVTRYREVNLALKDPRFLVAQTQARVYSEQLRGVYDMGHIERAMSKWLLYVNPPQHTRLRSLIARSFTPRALERFEQAIQRQVGTLLDRVDQPLFEVLGGLARPLVSTTIMDLLGGDPEERRLAAWSHQLATFVAQSNLTVADIREADLCLTGLEETYREIVRDRRVRPQSDLVSFLLQVDLEDQEPTEDEIVSTCSVLVAAAHDTTTNLIGNCLMALLEHPIEYRKVRDDPSLVEAALEETLRYDGPSQMVARIAAEDLELGGCRVFKGQGLNLCLGAANRDPEQFDDPDSFRIERGTRGHLGFGSGVHACVGAFLARRMARVAITELLKRWPALALASPPQRDDTFALRRLQDLTLRLSP